MCFWSVQFCWMLRAIKTACISHHRNLLMSKDKYIQFYRDRVYSWIVCLFSRCWCNIIVPLSREINRPNPHTNSTLQTLLCLPDIVKAKESSPLLKVQQFQIYSIYSTAIQNNQFSSNMNKITYLLRTQGQGHNRGGMLADEHDKEMGILLTLSKCVLLSGYQKKVKELFVGLHFNSLFYKVVLIQKVWACRVVGMI